MSTDPIAAAEMAGIVQKLVNIGLCGIAETPDGGAFEMTAPATGQRFRVTVTEVAGWSDQMDRELEEVTRTETTR